MADIKFDTSNFETSEGKTPDKSNSENKIVVKNLSAYYGEKQVLFDISTIFPEKSISALIGPSGCGKSTFIRSLNRLHEISKDAKVEGEVYLDNYNIYEQNVNPVLVRRKIGMVFQKPNPFPHMSIYDNVVAGLKLQNVRDKGLLDEVVEKSLSIVGLLDEVKDDIHKKKGTDLSGGQQQRLCIARTIAVEPEVILMDEPTASLDPGATLVIEELLQKLKEDYTVLIVTHNMQQAARISDYTLFLYLGKLIERGETEKIFVSPKNDLTEQYFTGRFG